MSISEITPDQARTLLDQGPGYIYLDVRTVPEFEAGRPPGALNIPIACPNPATGQMEFNLDFLRIIDERISRDAKIIVGCQSGGRSARACEILQNEGYKNVVNLAGGFGGVHAPGGRIFEPGWSTLGYRVETGDAGERSYESLSRK